MEVVKTENIKQEETDAESLSTINVSSGIECIEQMTFKCDNAENEVGLGFIKHEKNTEEENNAAYDMGVSIKTEVYDIKDELDVEEYELNCGELKSIKTEDYKIDPGNTCLEQRSAQSYVLLDESDSDIGQYVNDLVTIKHEQKVGKQDTFDVSEAGMEKQNAVSKYQHDHCKYETEDVTNEPNTELHQSLLPVYEMKDESIMKTADEIFRCELCDYKTKHKRYLLQHHRTKHDDAAEIFRCELCDFKTKNKSHLSRHHRIKHDETEIFCCELCDYETKHKSSMSQHHRLKHDDTAQIFCCKQCDYKTKSKSNLSQHHTLKHDDTTQFFYCKQCGYKTKIKNSLLLHHRSKHDEAPRFFCCGLCDYKAKHKFHLSQHHKLKHDEAARFFYCELCDFKTKYRRNLFSHHISKHDDAAKIIYSQT